MVIYYDIKLYMASDNQIWKAQCAPAGKTREGTIEHVESGSDTAQQVIEEAAIVTLTRHNRYKK